MIGKNFRRIGDISAMLRLLDLMKRNEENNVYIQKYIDFDLAIGLMGQNNKLTNERKKENNRNDSSY